METVEELKVLKEKIIKTAQVLRMYSDIKSKYTELSKKHKQLNDEFSILKLDNDMKSYQYMEQSKEIEQLKTGHEKLTNENNSLKSTYDQHLNELVSLQMKYQKVCRDLDGSQKSEEVYPVEPIKKKKVVKKQKLIKKIDYTSAEDLQDEKPVKNGTVLNHLVDNEMNIKIEILGNEENVEHHSLNNYQNISTTENFKFTDDCKRDYLLELKKCEDEKSILIKDSEEREMNMRTEWQEKERKLKGKIEELQQHIEKEKNILLENFKVKECELKKKWEEKELKLKTKVAELRKEIGEGKSALTRSFEEKISGMKKEWQEKEKNFHLEIEGMKYKNQEEISKLKKHFEKKEAIMRLEWQKNENELKLKISNLMEELHFLEQREKCEKNITNTSVQNSQYENNSITPIFDNAFKDYVKQQNTPIVEELKQAPIKTSCSEDSESDEKILDIFREMRMVMLSPIPESPLQQDLLNPEDDKETSLPAPETEELSNLNDLKQDLSEESKVPDWRDRYLTNRKKKEIKYHRLSTIKKAKQKFWLELSQTFTLNRKNPQSVRRAKKAPARNKSASSEISEAAGSSNTIVNGIASVFADLVTQKLHNSRSRARATSERNVLEVNKMLLEKAKQENETKNLYKNEKQYSSDDEALLRQNNKSGLDYEEQVENNLANVSYGIPHEKHSTGMETPNFVDSCYESFISNPPSIQSLNKETMGEDKKEDKKPSMGKDESESLDLENNEKGEMKPENELNIVHQSRELLGDSKCSTDEAEQLRNNCRVDSKEKKNIENDKLILSNGNLDQKNFSEINTPNVVDSWFESILTDPPTILSPVEENMPEEGHIESSKETEHECKEIEEVKQENTMKTIILNENLCSDSRISIKDKDVSKENEHKEDLEDQVEVNTIFASDRRLHVTDGKDVPISLNSCYDSIVSETPNIHPPGEEIGAQNQSANSALWKCKSEENLPEVNEMLLETGEPENDIKVIFNNEEWERDLFLSSEDELETSESEDEEDINEIIKNNLEILSNGSSPEKIEAEDSCYQSSIFNPQYDTFEIHTKFSETDSKSPETNEERQENYDSKENIKNNLETFSDGSLSENYSSKKADDSYSQSGIFDPKYETLEKLENNIKSSETDLKALEKKEEVKEDRQENTVDGCMKNENEIMNFNSSEDKEVNKTISPKKSNISDSCFNSNDKETSLPSNLTRRSKRIRKSTEIFASYNLRNHSKPRKKLQLDETRAPEHCEVVGIETIPTANDEICTADFEKDITKDFSDDSFEIADDKMTDNSADLVRNSSVPQKKSLKLQSPTKAMKRKRPQKGALMAKSIKIYKLRSSANKGNQTIEIEAADSCNTETNNLVVSNQEIMQKSSDILAGGATRAKRRRLSSPLKCAGITNRDSQISSETLNNSMSPSVSQNAGVNKKKELSPLKRKKSTTLEPASKKKPLIEKTAAIVITDAEPTISSIQQSQKSETPSISLNLNSELNGYSQEGEKMLASSLERSKINIIQDIILRPKNKPAGNTEKKTGGFKRPLATKILPLCPQSPPLPEAEGTNYVEPVIIPLDKPKVLESGKAASLFRKLLTYSTEEKTVEEVAKHFSNQEPAYISRLILQQIIQDKEKPDAKVVRAPLMTHTQRVMLGFMLKLEKMNVAGLINTYLETSELYLLNTKVLAPIEPLTRLNVAICKSHGYIERMRKFCLEVFYFMGDLAIPFFFTVLTSWIEVLPPAADSEGFPLVKVLVQLVHLKTCNRPGYNLLPLRELLHKFYGYPNEPWNSDTFLKELFNNYLKNPAAPADFAILLYFKNNECKWVCQKIDSLIKPILSNVNVNFKATLIVFIGNIMSQFPKKSNWEYIESTKQWLENINEEQDVPEIVKKSISYAIMKLPRTGKRNNKSEVKQNVQNVDKPNM